ncbi:MAG: sugar transferase, partial [Calditrichia bacterium]|nr:sugar transferase [Calditrichia bacterium]
EELSGHELLKIFKTPLFYWQKSIKRLTDIIVSLIVITLFFPIALYIYVMSRKKIDHMFFSEEMIGQAGKNFKQYELFIVKNVNDNSSIITIPAIIRRLPSFWLVLKGKMSLVGPRPESSKWYEENFKKLPFIYQRLLVKPGVTGLSQIKYRYFESQKDPLERIKYDLYYFQNLSITLDLRIISRSILLTISDIINSIRRR